MIDFNARKINVNDFFDASHLTENEHLQAYFNDMAKQIVNDIFSEVTACVSYKRGDLVIEIDDACYNTLGSFNLSELIKSEINCITRDLDLHVDNNGLIASKLQDIIKELDNLKNICEADI